MDAFEHLKVLADLEADDNTLMSPAASASMSKLLSAIGNIKTSNVDFCRLHDEGLFFTVEFDGHRITGEIDKAGKCIVYHSDDMRREFDISSECALLECIRWMSLTPTGAEPQH